MRKSRTLLLFSTLSVVGIQAQECEITGEVPADFYKEAEAVCEQFDSVHGDASEGLLFELKTENFIVALLRHRVGQEAKHRAYIGKIVGLLSEQAEIYGYPEGSAIVHYRGIVLGHGTSFLKQPRVTVRSLEDVAKDFAEARWDTTSDVAMLSLEWACGADSVPDEICAQVGKLPSEELMKWIHERVCKPVPDISLPPEHRAVLCAQ